MGVADDRFVLLVPFEGGEIEDGVVGKVWVVGPEGRPGARLGRLR